MHVHHAIPRNREVVGESKKGVMCSVWYSKNENGRLGGSRPYSVLSTLHSQSAQTLCLLTNSPNSFIVGKSKYHERVFSNSFMTEFWSRRSPFASSSGIDGIAAKFIQKFASDEYASSFIVSLWGSLFSVDVISPPRQDHSHAASSTDLLRQSGILLQRYNAYAAESYQLILTPRV
jgi:hypothetical protein